MIQKVTSWLTNESKKNIDYILERANLFRAPDAMTYLFQTGRRMKYINDDMTYDGMSILKMEFRKLYKSIMNQQLQFPIAKFIVTKKAQTYRGRGQRFYLVDGNGNEAEPDSEPAQTFNDLVELSRLPLVLSNADETLEACHECGVRIWWDRGRIRLSKYDPDKVHFALNEYRLWDPDSSIAVAFEQTGVEGVKGEPSYEVWGARDKSVADATDEAGRPIFYPTVHYLHTSKGVFHYNDSDSNPFRFRGSEEPMLPVVWFQDEGGQNIYSLLGGDNLVMLNRVINLGMTWLNWIAHWCMSPIPVFDAQTGTEEQLDQLRKNYIHSPKNAMTLPPGIRMSFVSPDFNPVPFTNMYEMFIQYFGLMNRLSPRHLDIKGSSATSGIALRIELSGLNKYRDERVIALKEPTEDLMERMIVVNNTYNESKIPDDLYPRWDPGQMDSGPDDFIELGNRMLKEISAGTSSAVDWTMNIYGLDRSTAEKKIQENIDFTRKIKEALFVEGNTENATNAISSLVNNI